MQNLFLLAMEGVLGSRFFSSQRERAVLCETAKGIFGAEGTKGRPLCTMRLNIKQSGLWWSGTTTSDVAKDHRGPPTPTARKVLAGRDAMFLLSARTRLSLRASSASSTTLLPSCVSPRVPRNHLPDTEPLRCRELPADIPPSMLDF